MSDLYACIKYMYMISYTYAIRNVVADVSALIETCIWYIYRVLREITYIPPPSAYLTSGQVVTESAEDPALPPRPPPVPRMRPPPPPVYSSSYKGKLFSLVTTMIVYTNTLT